MICTQLTPHQPKPLGVQIVALLLDELAGGYSLLMDCKKRDCLAKVVIVVAAEGGTQQSARAAVVGTVVAGTVGIVEAAVAELLAGPVQDLEKGAVVVLVLSELAQS